MGAIVQKFLEQTKGFRIKIKDCHKNIQDFKKTQSYYGKLGKLWTIG